MDPIKLPSNQPPGSFYKGGQQIADFRNEPNQGPRAAEDWIASTTCCNGESSLGKSKLADGSFLADEIAAHAKEWLGPEHLESFGVDTKLLVKFIDAGQRLPIHAHPHGKWAKAHLGTAHGKSEAWYILSPGEVYLGLNRDITAEELLPLVEKQDIETLIGFMHRVPVKTHQTVYVPAGTLHAIGEGVMVAEVQEPEDLSILLEWRDFQIDGMKDGHLGLGFEKALGAVDKTKRTEKEISSLVTEEGKFGSVLAKESNEYFILERLHFDSEEKCKPGFAILIALAGRFDLIGENGNSLPIAKGETVVIPYATGNFSLRGKGEVLVARPPPKA
ncbi:mannose-6-phosphate class i [Phlyctema vagabunda]|uniref:Mannose-6-phosphate class i n=1 Tax=Phlyctema vagabunda TaxID=108571 RepID=A0ABR4P645_9HELO